MKSSETVEPAVTSGEIGNTEAAGDGTRFPLEHGSGDADTKSFLVLVPFPDTPVGLFVASASGASLASANVRVGWTLLLLPLA